MKVYYDFQILFLQKYGGISRYFFELASRLRDLGSDIDINCLHSRNYYFRDQIKAVDYSKRPRIIRGSERRIFYRLNKAKALHDAKKNYDIIHPTYYDNYIIGHHSGKLVLTVHDMIHEKYGGDKETIASKKRMIYAADHLIAISQSTKNDILEIYPDINPGKISVVYHGASMSSSKGKGKRPIDKKYVLFVGSRSWYKNFVRFAHAMRPVLEAQPDLYVIYTDGGVLTPEERFAAGSFSNRFLQLNLDDNALAYAECFVFPSEYEGFGIPILESFACNCPLICSRSSSFPEVAGNAAEYFDPLDTDDISEKIFRVLNNKSLREKLRTAGRERLKLFSWDKTAQQTLECYRKAIEH